MTAIDAAEFKSPKDCYRGLDLWMVNDRLEDDELVHQVYEFRDKGLYSVIFRTYNGLYSDYPGPEFQKKVRVAVNAARDCGLKIVLQAGYMPSAFPDLPPEYMLHHIEPIQEERLNGVLVGSLSRAPYTVAAGTALRSGKNKIDIRLYGTLRNAVGPSHLNGKDCCACHRGVWLNPLLPANCENEERTGDFELIPFGLGEAQLIWTQPSY